MSIFKGKVLRDEPVLLTGLAQAIIALLLAFGISMSQEQVGSIMAVLAVVVAIATRMLVTPNTKVPEPGAPTPTSPVPPEPPMYPDLPGE
jgi:hypothetical protein